MIIPTIQSTSATAWTIERTLKVQRVIQSVSSWPRLSGVSGPGQVDK